jgi:hypothetical protein
MKTIEDQTLEYAEALNDIADILQLPTGVTSAEIVATCRESLIAESMQTQRRVIDWQLQSDEGLRLRCGELTAQEIRSIKAVLNAILPNV